MADDKIIYDVDLVADVKSLVAMNSDISWADDKLKDKLLTLGEDDLVRVGKKIGSLKIMSIDLIDNDFLIKVFGGESDGKNQVSP